MGREMEMTFFQRRLTNGLQVLEKVVNVTNDQDNANENHNETSSPSPFQKDGWLSGRQEITNAGENTEKREPSCTAGGNGN